MAKSVGLDAGEFEVKVVELDGSLRKPRLTSLQVDRVCQMTSSASDPGHASAEAEALLHAVKDGHVSKQNVCLGFSSREAVFRLLTVPFTGEDRIRRVIKFEAEGEIHGQSVDDMVIDFHVVEEKNDETRVLVAGVPKAPLRTTLDALERVGLEPETVDLDTMALYRVAEWSGALAPDDDLTDEESTTVTSRVVLDLGARACRVLVVSASHLQDTRTIPLGSDSIAEDLATSYGLTLEQGREAMIHCLTTGQDFDAASFDEVPPAEDEYVIDGSDYDDDDDDDDDDGDDGEENLPARSDFVPCAAVLASRDKFLARLRREFMRFLVASKGVGEIEAAFTTGAGATLPGVSGLLAEVFGCDPQPLLFMELLQHNLSEDEVEYMEPRIAVAVGLALGQLGGRRGFNFRQEDLVYTRGFDRVKLPLAIACMLGLFFLFFWGVGLNKQLRAKQLEFGMAYDKKVKGRAGGRETGKSVKTYKQYSGYMAHLVNDSFWPQMKLPHNEYRKMVSALAEKPTFERIKEYRKFLVGHLRKVQKKGQYEPGLALDSGVAVLQQFAGIVQSVEESLGRFYIGEIDLELPTSPAISAKGKTKNRGRKLVFKMYIVGDDFRARNRVLQSAFEEACKDPKSPFLELTGQPKQDPVEGVAWSGSYYTYTIELKNKIPVQRL